MERLSANLPQVGSSLLLLTSFIELVHIHVLLSRGYQGSVDVL